MRKGITVTVNASDRARLEAVVANRNSPQKHVWRCRIVLLTADGLGTAAIMQRTGKSRYATVIYLQADLSLIRSPGLATHLANEALLPAPHTGLVLAGPALDAGRTDTIGCQ